MEFLIFSFLFGLGFSLSLSRDPTLSTEQKDEAGTESTKESEETTEGDKEEPNR